LNNDNVTGAANRERVLIMGAGNSNRTRLAARRRRPDAHARRNELWFGNDCGAKAWRRRNRRSATGATGSLANIFKHFPWVGNTLPAMGYSPAQLEDLAATINATPCDSIVVATPVDLARLIPFTKPYCRVRYDLEEISRPDLADVISGFVHNMSVQCSRVREDRRAKTLEFGTVR